MTSKDDEKRKYLLEVSANVKLSEENKIRRQLSLLNGEPKGEASRRIRFDLLNQYSRITGEHRTDEHIKKLSQQMISNRGHANRWKSGLCQITDEELRKRFPILVTDGAIDGAVGGKEDNLVISWQHKDGIKEKLEIEDKGEESDECEVVDVVSNSASNRLFGVVGRFESMVKDVAEERKVERKQNQSSKFCSPPRISGLLKRRLDERSPNDAKALRDMNDKQLRNQFLTGLEKQLIDKMRKDGDVKEARATLEAARQPFRNPIKQKYNANNTQFDNPIISDERLKGFEPKMVEMIYNEIIDLNASKTEWKDIAGLEYQKRKIKEIVVLPLLRPDLFTGLRSPPKGLLLFGPPGTGKTLIGRCVASQSKSTFFSITASSLTSKWIGEGEKMVRTMFAVARVLQPSVIFIDEIDSLLTQRSDTEHDSSRRMKTEFLAQFDGVFTAREEKLLIIGATNRPQELDDAARRRFASKLYIPLPDESARIEIIRNCLQKEKNSLSDGEIADLAQKTDGYSGADMFSLCHESAMESMRANSLIDQIRDIEKDDIRAICHNDFLINLQVVKPSVGDLHEYINWNEQFGTNLPQK